MHELKHAQPFHPTYRQINALSLSLKHLKKVYVKDGKTNLYDRLGSV